MNIDSNSPTAPRMLSAEINEQKCLDLRIAGYTYRKIGEALGLSHEGCRKAVARALDDLVEEKTEKAERLRELELQRLDKMASVLWTQVQNGNHGAIDKVLKIMDRRAKYLGLDAPTMIMPVAADTTMAELDRIRKQYAHLAGETPDDEDKDPKPVRDGEVIVMEGE